MGNNALKLFFALISNGFLITVIGYGLLYLSGVLFIKYRKRKRILETWPSVNAKVVEIKIKKNQNKDKDEEIGPNDEGDYIKKIIKINYPIENSINSIEFERKFIKPLEARLVGNFDFQIGQEIPIYYNPKKPQKVAFSDEVPQQVDMINMIAAGLGGIIFFVGGIAMMVSQ
jgi:hypothetical protein